MNALTIGIFDGVHRGHQHLLQKLSDTGCFTQAITFSNHPSEVLQNSSEPLALTPLPLKLALLSESGVNEIIALHFTHDLARLTYDEFLAPYSIKHLIIGDDAAIGQGRKGTPDALRLLGIAKGFQVHLLPKLCADEAPISSTRIRSLIIRGNLEQAEALLGRPYCFLMSSAKKHATLPPDGRYKVWAHSPAGIIPTTLTIQNRTPLIALENPQLISFGPNLNPTLFNRLCLQTSLAAL